MPPVGAHRNARAYDKRNLTVRLIRLKIMTERKAAMVCAELTER